MTTLGRAGIGIFFLISLGLLGTGCDWYAFDKQAANLWADFWGQPLPFPTGVPTPKPVAKPDPDSEGFVSSAARNAKENSELFHEIFVDVFMREPKDRSEFGSWVDSLNQGASLEGVHNGLIKSSDYRSLETSSKAANVVSLRVFAEELARLEVELPEPVEFEPGTYIPNVPMGSVPSPTPVPVVGFAPEAALPGPQGDLSAKIPPLAQKYSKVFVTASLFTLKRVLAEEGLRVFSYENQFKEKACLWYSKWAVHMAGLGVDFGIALRNRPDEQFHYKWALVAPTDRVVWETLNRLHRVMNASSQPK